jgi:hypothetical protein
MNPVYTFANRLSELTQQNNAACVGLICLAIKDAGKDAQGMKFQDYRDLFQNHLPKRLDRMKIPNSEKVGQELITFLNQKQSIFTMMAH